jgi:hypothetical protein
MLWLWATLTLQYIGLDHLTGLVVEGSDAMLVWVLLVVGFKCAWLFVYKVA